MNESWTKISLSALPTRRSALCKNCNPELSSFSIISPFVFIKEAPCLTISHKLLMWLKWILKYGQILLRWIAMWYFHSLQNYLPFTLFFEIYHKFCFPIYLNVTKVFKIPIMMQLYCTVSKQNEHYKYCLFMYNGHLGSQNWQQLLSFYYCVLIWRKMAKWFEHQKDRSSGMSLNPFTSHSLFL